MNPNLNYAQVIRGPGKQLGDSAGVLDMETIAKIASGVAVMRMSGAAEWKYATDVGLVNWAKEMVNWLTTNEAALGEKNATKWEFKHLPILREVALTEAVITERITSTSSVPSTSCSTTPPLPSPSSNRSTTAPFSLRSQPTVISL